MNTLKVFSHVAIGLFFIGLVVFLSCAPVIKSPVVSDNSSPPIQVPIPDKNGIRLKIGDVAPDFTLKDLEGNSVSLSEFRGKKVVVNLWWLRCHGCADEMPYFQEFYQKSIDTGLVLLAINSYDTDTMIKDFAVGKGLTFTLLVDSGKQLDKVYTNAGVPTTYFIDQEGIVKAIKDGGFENTAEIESMYQSY